MFLQRYPKGFSRYGGFHIHHGGGHARGLANRRLQRLYWGVAFHRGRVQRGFLLSRDRSRGTLPWCRLGTTTPRSLDPIETERVLGWKAEVGFEETIGRMLAWYDRHGISAIHSHLSEPES